MKVKAITKKISADIFEKYLSKISSSNEYDHIEVGKVYVVHGIVFWESMPFYYIYEDEDFNYPKPIFSGYFEVVDKNLSKYWSLAMDSTALIGFQAYLVFKDWAESLDLYERLIDGEKAAEDIFSKYKILLENES